jgi:inositol oxygenase
MATLRNYEQESKQCELYSLMYKNQDLKFVLHQKGKYEKLNNKIMNIHKALYLMDTFIDTSDPDVNEPNSVHAYQTAERIRKKYPEDKEYQIIGLIHDIGKVLFTFGEPEWSITGDTFVVGCKLPESMVYYNEIKDHPDINNTLLGIYEKGCGIENLNISFGHDEYLYQVLKQNNKNHKISEKYWDIIRYHSFYPWHDKGEYKHFMNGEKDLETLKLVQEFNQFDLYSKEDIDLEITDEIKKYYENLLNDYFFKELQW